MKNIPHEQPRLLATWAVLALCATALNAGTVSHTFSFQQGDLRQDGAPYGSADTYAGVVDGRFTDTAAANALNPASGTIGNQFRSSSNGQQWVSLFSYDLTELNDFITANTSTFSSVAITSVSLKLVSTGGSSNAQGNVYLYQTDPFTSGATWSTTDGTNAWSSPFQDIGSTAQYGYTGGGSPLTGNLGGTFPYVNVALVTAGASVQWTSSTAFLDSVADALGRGDKTLYLMAARANISNQDSRVNVNTSAAATVDDRPELLITLEVTTTASSATWTGASDTSWTTATNWSPNSVPATDAPIVFDSSSTANLNTVLNQDFTVASVTLTNPTGAVSIGGANNLNLGSGGFDLSSATQNLAVSAPVVLGATQTWNVASGHTLSVSGGLSGNFPLTLAGAGKVSLGASNILPSGASAGNLIVSGTLDLNGTSQSINALTGNGIVDNTGAGTATLTIGNNDAGGTFSGTIQDTGGDLALVKTGTGTLTLSNANTYNGGFTLNGGIVNSTGAAGANTAFGSGPVVVNSGSIYMASASYTFANTLTLNGGTLRQGGGNNRLLTWSGPVSVPASSEIRSDGGTAGTTISGNVTLSSGAILSSTGNGTANSVTGSISGNGDVTVTSGTLALNGTGSYTGSTLISAGVLRLDPTGTIPASSPLTINGAGNFAVRNTANWTYSGTITGDGTGSINLNTGTNATLAGPISGVLAINVNTSGTDATISGNISGATNINVQNTGGNILRLTGSNSYTGGITISGGKLVINSIKDYGVNSAAGAPVSGSIQLGSGSNFANLEYNGAGDSTNRTVQLGDAIPENTGVGSMSNDGTGALTFTAANFNTPITGITAARTLWLGGTYTGGPNEIQGIIQDNDTTGAVNVGKANDASIWLLSGANTYTGNTIVQGGTLKLGATGSIASSTALSLSAGGTLDTTAHASHTIPATQAVEFGIDAANTGSSGIIAAAGLDVSSAIVTYNITGTPDDPVYVLATYSSLTGTFATVDAPPAGYTLNYAYDGNKIALVQNSVADPYTTWASQIPDEALRGRASDADGDGFSNQQEFLFGTSPIASNGSLSSTEKSGSNLIIRWNERTSGATYTLKQSATLNNDWVTSSVVPTNDGAAIGDYQPRTATIAIGSDKLFFRVEGVEN